MEDVVECARIIERHCSKTTNCMKCPLFENMGEGKGYCKIEGTLPWEWEFDNESSQLDSKEK